MKVPVKESILSGDWIECHGNVYPRDEYVVLRFKPLSFAKINMQLIDEWQKIELDQGVLWLLKIDIVNYSKSLFSACQAKNIVVIDQDDFIFDSVHDDHLSIYSKYAKSSGINRLYGIELLPKIKSTLSIPFLLPDDDQAEYFFSIKNGSIKAI